MKSRALWMLGNCVTTELHCQPWKQTQSWLRARHLLRVLQRRGRGEKERGMGPQRSCPIVDSLKRPQSALEKLWFCITQGARGDRAFWLPIHQSPDTDHFWKEAEEIPKEHWRWALSSSNTHSSWTIIPSSWWEPRVHFNICHVTWSFNLKQGTDLVDFIALLNRESVTCSWQCLWYNWRVPRPPAHTCLHVSPTPPKLRDASVVFWGMVWGSSSWGNLFVHTKCFKGSLDNCLLHINNSGRDRIDQERKRHCTFLV